MSVIIRLQNLPWSANALDIRQFFRGLSIPEGGVHIVGGEMGDAFIAFSTDEDARQAMMFDREAINGVQIRLLLSSRAEMQKVIETARQQSLLALKKASATAVQPKVSTPMVAAVQKPIVASTPQPPIITANSFKSIIGHNATVGATPSFLAYQQQAGFTLFPESNITNSIGAITASATKNGNDSDGSESRQSREKRRSNSRERRRSRSRSRERSVLRRRREKSRDKSREHDRSNNKRSSRQRSRSRERSRARSRERSRERSHERSRTNNNRDHNRQNSRDDNRSRSMDTDNKSNSNVTVWSSANAYKANFNTAETGSNFLNRSSTIPGTNKSEKSSKSMDTVSSSAMGVSVTSVSTTFQNYNTTNQTQTAVNNYSLSSFLSAGNSNDSLKAFALQNPYTTALNAKPQDATLNTTSSSAIPGIFVEKKSDDNNLQATALDATNSLPQEPIAFANVNPYEQMYPNLFAQAAAINSGQKLAGIKQSSMTSPANSPRAEDNTKPKDVDPNDTSCVKISNMCSRTTYSDLRKFFGGLFIPHNGIKLLNDKHGLRIGIAYVQFSRQSSVPKALCRSNNIFKGKSVIIEPVSEQEFNEAEDSFRPPNQDKAYSHRSNDSDNENSDSGNNNYGALNPYKKMINLEPFTVLYIEDIPALATEQDIMKMFSSYSLYDILLIASPENRREFVAHVRFSREEDAKSAYEDRAHHQIGYRRVRMRPGSIEEMENAKEKIRLANEQLMKEEQAAEEEETKRKLEKLINERITLEEDKKHQQQKIISMDLTQEDADEDDENDVIETTDDLKNSSKNRHNRNYDLENYRNSSDTRNNKFNMNVDPRRPQTPQLNNNIPSLFDFDPLNNANMPCNQNRPNLFNDPRLRNMSEREAAAVRNMDSCNTNQGMANNNFNNFTTNFNNQSPTSPPINNMMNNTENNFVILKNCDYGTRINDVAQLLLTVNLGLKHIEPLHNERQLPTGEFIVEFRRPNDAEIAIQRFHNIQFRNRSLRVFPITPQEIADRLGKPFLNYIPGGNGIRMNKGMSGDSNMQRNNNNNQMNNNNNNNNRFNNIASQNMNCNNFRGNNPFSDNNGSMNNNGRNNNGGGGGGGGIPEKFTRPGCVLSLENVPYKAQLSDILRFFQGFDLTPDDIIRRYNDDGTPTGDARVAFVSPDEARAAYDAKKRKQIFGRNVYISIV